MRIRRVLLTGAIAAVSVFSQEKAPPAEPDAFGKPSQATIIPVKTPTGDSFNRLVKMLSVFNVRYAGDERMRSILVYAPADVVTQMRKVVEELDRPGSEAAIGRNIDLSMALLRCSTTPQRESGVLPADLESAVRQLKAATQYKYIQLMDVIPMRVQEGRDTEQELRMPNALPDIPGAGASTSAYIRLRPESVTKRDGERYVRFDQLNIRLRIPYSMGPKPQPGTGTGSFQITETSLKTAGDFREGQKTIVGKLSGMEDGTAIFVVISLKVLDDAKATQ